MQPIMIPAAVLLWTFLACRLIKTQHLLCIWSPITSSNFSAFVVKYLATKIYMYVSYIFIYVCIWCIYIYILGKNIKIHKQTTKQWVLLTFCRLRPGKRHRRGSFCHGGRSERSNPFAERDRSVKTKKIIRLNRWFGLVGLAEVFVQGAKESCIHLHWIQDLEICHCFLSINHTGIDRY